MTLDPAVWVRRQLSTPRPPSDAWILEFLIDTFGQDAETATTLLKDAKDSLS